MRSWSILLSLRAHSVLSIYTEKELVKLEAYTLTQHPVVVHLDLDVVVLKPMDVLFDWMLVDHEHLKIEYDTSDVPIMWRDHEQPQRPNAFFTRDCKFENMVSLYVKNGQISFKRYFRTSRQHGESLSSLQARSGRLLGITARHGGLQ